MASLSTAQIADSILRAYEAVPMHACCQCMVLLSVSIAGKSTLASGDSLNVEGVIGSPSKPPNLGSPKAKQSGT